MSYLDNLESNLKNLENSQEQKGDLQRDRQHRASEKARALAAAPHADALKNGPFTHELLSQVTAIGFARRMKVQPTWLGNVLRLQAKERRMELRPLPDGVRAFFFEENEEMGNEPVDLQGNALELAKRWLET